MAYTRYGQVLLDDLKRRMAFQNLSQHVSRVTLINGTEIVCQSIFGQDQVTINTVAMITQERKREEEFLTGDDLYLLIYDGAAVVYNPVTDKMVKLASFPSQYVAIERINPYANNRSYNYVSCPCREFPGYNWEIEIGSNPGFFHDVGYKECNIKLIANTTHIVKAEIVVVDYASTPTKKGYKLQINTEDDTITFSIYAYQYIAGNVYTKQTVVVGYTDEEHISIGVVSDVEESITEEAYNALTNVDPTNILAYILNVFNGQWIGVNYSCAGQQGYCPLDADTTSRITWEHYVDEYGEMWIPMCGDPLKECQPENLPVQFYGEPEDKYFSQGYSQTSTYEDWEEVTTLFPYRIPNEGPYPPASFTVTEERYVLVHPVHDHYGGIHYHGYYAGMPHQALTYFQTRVSTVGAGNNAYGGIPYFDYYYGSGPGGSVAYQYMVYQIVTTVYTFHKWDYDSLLGGWRWEYTTESNTVDTSEISVSGRYRIYPVSPLDLAIDVSLSSSGNGSEFTAAEEAVMRVLPNIAQFPYSKCTFTGSSVSPSFTSKRNPKASKAAGNSTSMCSVLTYSLLSPYNIDAFKVYFSKLENKSPTVWVDCTEKFIAAFNKLFEEEEITFDSAKFAGLCLYATGIPPTELKETLCGLI